MISSRTRAVVLMLPLVFSLAAFPQTLSSQLKKAVADPQAPAGSTDPLGRETPAGTVFGFLQAAQAGNFRTAAQYLQFRTSTREAEREDTAAKLKTVIDRGFQGSLKNISSQPEGNVQPGVAADRQVLGLLSAGDVEVQLDLVRTNDPSSGRIWLIAQDTVERLPELYDQLQARQIEKEMPSALVTNALLGIPLWQWLAMLLALPLAALVGWLLVRVIAAPRAAWAKYRHQAQRKPWTPLSGPLWLLFAVVVHGLAVSYLRLPLLQRHYYVRISVVMLIVAATWLALRIVSRAMRRLRDRAIAMGRKGTGSLILLGQRVLNLVLIIISVLGILGSLGFNLTTALAGLGIGGLAVAFAAQKTLENLFGGVSLLGDEVIRVGDVCRIGERVGTVEDISLRSTRLRTVERTEMSIPNGSLATMNLENLTRRDKFLFNGKLALRYETSADQLRYVLAEIRRMFYEHPKVETASARVRFLEFGESALNLEFFSYILTVDNGEFTAIREDLLLRIMDIVTNSGAAFAFPSQTLYMARDQGMDTAKTEAAVATVQRWREEKHLPFPDFAPADISEFRGSIAYPQPDSAVGNHK